jgi:hypothetical protein
MARINSLQGRIKFPVPMRRELGRKPLNSAIDFEPIVALGGLDNFGIFRDEFAADSLLQQTVRLSPAATFERQEPGLSLQVCEARLTTSSLW